LGLRIVIGQQEAMTADTNKLLALGSLFLAVPMAVFGMGHFVFTGSVVTMVPSWIPWHLF